MNLTLIKKYCVHGSLLLSLLLMNVVSYAEDNIPCPSVNIIKSSYQKLDTAIKINDKYLTYTSTYFSQSNDLWWFAGVGYIKADSSEEAIFMGKNILNNVSIQVDVNAQKVGNEYICNYGPGYIQARGKNF